MVYVPPKYPSEIPTIEDLPNRQDDVHWLVAARYNELKKELRACLTELGTLPKGEYADVKTRLDNIAVDIPYILLKDEKPSGTAGGTFTKDAWRTRDINVEEIDTGNNCSIDGNQITLDPGTYECIIKCPTYRVEGHKTRLYNITDTSLELEGTSEYARNSYLLANSSFIMGRFIIAAQKIFEIQHYCKTTFATQGFGVQAVIPGVNEVYTIAEFRKVA